MNVQQAADELKRAFNDPFWRGSSVQASMNVLADFVAGIEDRITKMEQAKSKPTGMANENIRTETT